MDLWLVICIPVVSNLGMAKMIMKEKKHNLRFRYLTQVGDEVSIRGVDVRMILCKNPVSGKNEKWIKVKWIHQPKGYPSPKES